MRLWTVKIKVELVLYAYGLVTTANKLQGA